MLWRLLKAVMVGALVGPWLLVKPALIAGVGTYFSDLRFGPDAAALLAKAMFLGYVMAFPVVLVLAVTIGIPVDRLMQRRGWQAAWSYILAGGLSGMALGLLWGLATGPVVWWWNLSPVLTGGMTGAVTALVWWRGGRPPAPSGSPGE